MSIVSTGWKHVVFVVSLDRVVVGFATQQMAQHVTHQAALLVEVAVEQVDRLTEGVANQRPAIATVFTEVDLAQARRA
jgi:hypothetical protein